MNILIIEPDRILASNFEKTFKNNGLKATIVADPQVAIEQMDIELPAAIVIELQLAPLSGIAFLHELRSYEDFAAVPVVVYSSVPKESFKLGDKGWYMLGVVKYFYKARISSNKVASFLKGYLDE